MQIHIVDQICLYFPSKVGYEIAFLKRLKIILIQIVLKPTLRNTALNYVNRAFPPNANRLITFQNTLMSLQIFFQNEA